MKKKILVTGANGMLGQKIVDLLHNNPQYTTLFCARGSSRLNPDYDINYQILDSGDKEKVTDLITHFEPDAIINCAAFTHVDACEDQPEACDLLNIKAVEFLIDAIGEKNIHLVHISTDFVFDGTVKTAYKETDAINPLSRYGWSKAESEKLLKNSKIPYTILRTSFVYGILHDNTRMNFVTWAKSSLENKQKITVITDQFRPPTLAEDLAKACVSSIERKAFGIFHTTGPETFSIIQLIEMVADHWKLDKSFILPTETKDLNQKAQRPQYTFFDISKAREQLNYQPTSFLESLKIIEKQLLDTQK
ncbi:MAG: SDR family oxidoreductase [Flavobacteriales bacterium]|jgi:dTDP-4-dehydrorhamnose reductase|nr:SDR family oxidoreductase [Flavobacteriales bacterium]